MTANAYRAHPQGPEFLLHDRPNQLQNAVLRVFKLLEAVLRCKRGVSAAIMQRLPSNDYATI